MGRMIFMDRLLVCIEMTSAAQRDGYALHEGVIVILKDQGWPDDLWTVRKVQPEILLPANASERFSTNVHHVVLTMNPYPEHPRIRRPAP